MVRISELILTIKRSPFVPIAFYRDPPAHAGVFMRSEDTYSRFFSESSADSSEPAEAGERARVSMSLIQR